MAVKIARQPNKIALLGAPTSAAAMSAGHEAAPSALRAAGLIERLTSIGYQVADLGDDPPQLYQPDEESPRARNLPAVVVALETLKPRVEQAIKSGALPIILSGDCTIALATVAAARRYFRNVGLIYIDRDADVNTPATTPSGCVDGMVVSHLAGRGAAELVRFWGEPPLVREPDLALFGVDRLDPAEEETLRRSAFRRYMADDVKRLGPAAAAQNAIERTHGSTYEFILHFDVDVIADFQATNYPGTGGLTLDEVREALETFLKQKNLAAIEITAYNPTRDPDGAAAKAIIELFTGALEKRLDALKAASAATAAAGASPSAAPEPAPQTPPPSTAEPQAPARPAEPAEAPVPDVQPGQAWSSDTLEKELEHTDGATEGSGEPSQPVESSGDSVQSEPGVDVTGSREQPPHPRPDERPDSLDDKIQRDAFPAEPPEAPEPAPESPDSSPESPESSPESDEPSR